MNLSEARDWVTFAGAIVGGIGGVLSFWWKARGKADKILVGMDTIHAEQLPQTMLHVVNRCDHSIVIADYGFIKESGELVSLPEMWEEWPVDEDGLTRGQLSLPSRNASFEAGTTLSWRAVGCFARTSSQQHMRVAFRRDLAFHRGLWIRLRAWISRL